MFTSYARRYFRTSLIVVTLLSFSFALSSNYFLDVKDLPENNFFNVSMTQFLVKRCDDTASDCMSEESLMMEGTASGVAILSTSGTTYVLTADHFCHPGEFSFNIINNDNFKFVTESDIWVTNDKGTTHMAEIAYSDSKKDLCLLETNAEIKENISLAQTTPQLGEKVYSISAPYGIRDRGVSLHFEGIFSGCDLSDICYYTIPATEGSSGSLVFDNRGRIIGMIQMTTVGFNAVSIGVGVDTIRTFLIESQIFNHSYF